MKMKSILSMLILLGSLLSHAQLTVQVYERGINYQKNIHNVLGYIDVSKNILMEEGDHTHVTRWENQIQGNGQTQRWNVYGFEIESYSSRKCLLSHIGGKRGGVLKKGKYALKHHYKYLAEFVEGYETDFEMALGNTGYVISCEEGLSRSDNFAKALGKDIYYYLQVVNN